MEDPYQAQNHPANWVLVRPESQNTSLTRTELAKKQLGLPHDQEKIMNGIAAILRPPKERFAILPAPPKQGEASEKFHETLISMENMPPPDLGKLKEPVYRPGPIVAESTTMEPTTENQLLGSAERVAAMSSGDLLAVMDQEYLEKVLASHFEGDSLMWMDGCLGSEDDARVFRFLYGEEPPKKLEELRGR